MECIDFSIRATFTRASLLTDQINEQEIFDRSTELKEIVFDFSPYFFLKSFTKCSFYFPNPEKFSMRSIGNQKTLLVP